ncbi:hypothetical protein [Metabacillus bambusae]|uniref:Uncharacterized protein n=1 Tax=Metabacillus bambusae TaxID=2795218 RepID=A0ABS3NBA8_9BACI|nr:hypothetical protein [Metabacillus bambusae]MBO1515487.1 hypothetical protein [Metabacillus bambusae]
MMINQIFALMLFMVGIWLGSTIDPLFGVITVLGGLLLGFSISLNNGVLMDKKSKVLLYASIVFLLILMSLAYITVSTFYL